MTTHPLLLLPTPILPHDTAIANSPTSATENSTILPHDTATSLVLPTHSLIVCAVLQNFVELPPVVRIMSDGNPLLIDLTCNNVDDGAGWGRRGTAAQIGAHSDVTAPTLQCTRTIEVHQESLTYQKVSHWIELC